jgi:nucleoside-diphosphate-sugar epimerase
VKALVTGATGFVGSHVVEALKARGDAVVALYRRPEARAALEALGAVAAPGSLEDEAALRAALAGVDVVYHVAGLVAGTPEALTRVNETGTQRLLGCCRDLAVPRFVLVSSQAALGPSVPGVRLTEDAPCRPVTPYGRSKLAGELVVRAETRVAWTIVRPPAVYGPRDREFLRLFQIVRRGLAPVFGWGTQELSLVHATDLADAIARAGRMERAAGQVYHAAHREIITAANLARVAGTAVGRRPVVVPVPGFLAAPIVWAIDRAARRAGRTTVVTTDKLAEFLAPAWLLDSGKAERELGWTATLDAAAGMRAAAVWYREQGWLP